MVLGTILGSCSVGSLVLSSIDSKRFAAASSVIHMQCVLLLLAMSSHSGCVAGAMLQLLAHSWIAGSLFYLIGETYEIQGSRLSRSHTHYGRASTAMLFLLLANAGFPCSASFLAEWSLIAYSITGGLLAIALLLGVLGGILSVIGLLHWAHGHHGRHRLHGGIHVALQGPSTLTVATVMGMSLTTYPSSLAWSALHPLVM